MNNAIWSRARGRDLELWRAGVRLAVVRPTGEWHTEEHEAEGREKTIDLAKTAARAAVAKSESGDK
jgi:hypothetical protein